MSIHAHGWHPWMRMGTGDYCAGSGHKKESKSATDGRLWIVGARQIAKDNHKTRLGDDGQGMLAKSRILTGGNVTRAKALSKTRQK